MSAARRLAARAAWLELTAVAEFTRRREAQLADATARKVPRGCRDGEFPDAELGMELVTSQNAARDTMDLADDLPTRLPRTWAALGAGLIDEYRARLIWRPTRHLSDADAAQADEILAALAPGLRYDQLARKATAVAMKLDPEAFTRGKDKARAGPAAGGGRAGGVRQRVPVRPRAGDRGRAGVQGAHRRARGRAAPRRAARHPAAAAGAGLQRPDPGPRPARPPCRTPARRRRPSRTAPATALASSTGARTGDGDRGERRPTTMTTPMPTTIKAAPPMMTDQLERRCQRGDDNGGEDDDGWDDAAEAAPATGLAVRPGRVAPFPALINLTVPACNTAYGWSAAPGEAGGWGLTDPDDTRRLRPGRLAASPHPLVLHPPRA